MKNLRLLTILTVFVFSSLVAGGTPRPAPVLSSAELFTRTGGDNKDKDTGVYVYARTSDKQTVLAKIENADNCSRDACQYNDHSEHTVGLVVQSQSTKSQCQGFVVELGSRANGNDKWEIEIIRVTLHFSDGTNLVKEVRSRTLNSRGSNYTSTEF